MLRNWLKTKPPTKPHIRRRAARSRARWLAAEVLEDRTLLSATLSVLPGAEAFEADGSLNFTVALSEPVDLPVSVEFMTVDGTATAGSTALTFDGLDDYVQVNSDLSPAADSNALTLSAWVYVRGVNTDAAEQPRQPIIAKGFTGQWEYALHVYDDLRAAFEIWQNNGNNHALAIGGSLTLNQWHHVAGTYERGGSTNLYIDGVLVASSSDQSGDPGNGTRPIRIGSREDGQYLNASIDEVRIYDVALSQTEIQATMNEILTGDEPGLLASWRFEEGTGNVAHDQTSGHHDGLLGGISGPAWTTSGDFLPGDYVKTVQTVTFHPGDPLTQIVSVPLLTDDLDEPDETVFAFLDNVRVTGGVRDVSVVNGSGGETLYAIDTVSDELVTIDADTGQIDLVAPLAREFIQGKMAFLNGTIYAVTSDSADPFSFPNWNLVAIDPTDATILHDVPLSVNGAQPFIVSGLTARDGKLFVLFDDRDLTESVLGELDPATGVITKLVDFRDVTGTNIDMDSLGVDPDGTFYSVDIFRISGDFRTNSIFRLDENPYDVTFVGSVDGNNIGLGDLTTDGVDFLAISGGDNTLYRVDTTLPPTTVLETVPVDPTANLGGLTSNFQFGVAGTIKNSIPEEPQPPLATLTVLPGAEAFEADEELNFTVALSAPVDLPVSVEFVTFDGTATAASHSADYRTTVQTVTFNPGEPLTQIVSVPLLTDDLDESDETVFAFLGDVMVTGGVRDVRVVNGIRGETLYSIDLENDELVTIDAVNGQIDVVGPLSRNFFQSDMTYLNGTIYAVTSDSANAFNDPDWSLLAIDPADASVLRDVPLSVNGAQPRIVEGLAVRDGQLLVVFDDHDTNSSVLGAVDPVSGVITKFVDFEDVTGTDNDMDALVVDPNGTLYSVDIRGISGDLRSNSFFRLDEDPYDVTFVGSVDGTAFFTDLTTHGGDFLAMSIGDNSLYRIDTALPPTTLLHTVPLGVAGANLQGLTSNFQFGVAGTIKNSESVPDDPPSNSVFAGFNDQTGINATAAAGLPYQIGEPLAGQGTGEPGWDGNWVRTVGNELLMQVQGDVVYEGDGALRIAGGTASAVRRLENPQTGLFYASQWIYLPAGGNLSARLVHGDRSVEGGTAAQWRVDAGGTFRVLDGVGNGCFSCSLENTGIAAPIEEWINVTVVVDMNARTWDFYVNGQRYEAPDPLGFRGTLIGVTHVDEVQYLVESQSGVYIDAVEVNGPITSFPIVPDLSGWWIIDGQAAQVLQLGGTLTFINEHNGVSAGRFDGDTQVAAEGWGDLAGEIVGDEIRWENGSVWTRIPTLPTTAVIDGSSPVLVQQSGIELRFTNEHGDMSVGHFLSASEVVADDWGNLTATIVGDDLQWDNGSVWAAADLSGVSVNLAGAWSLGGENATILQLGNDLLFVNEHGAAAAGVVVDATRVVATGWDNLGGTIEAATRRILWDNGTVWDRVPVLNRNENWHYNQQPTAVSQLGVEFLFTNEQGGRSRGSFMPSIGVMAGDWSLGGQIRFVAGQIAWNNLSVWSNSLFGDRDAVFADVNNWPWLG